MTDTERLRKLRRARAELEQTRVGWVQAKDNLSNHGHWKTAMQLLLALEEEFAPDVPALGPVIPGDKSLLLQSLTHATTGLSYYPAFDCGWKQGVSCLASEPVTVTRHSGNANSGFSVYATGESGLRYYYQHMESAGRAAVGSKVKKGGKIGAIGDFVGARVPHLHLGINIEQLAGKGKQLKYGKTGNGPPYTTGSPTVAVQLKEMT